MNKHRFWQYLVGTIGLAIAIPSMANAHTTMGDPSGFWHGIAHPFGGLDHILAMVAVGLWAVQLGSKALWMVPSGFVTAMAVGSIFGYFRLPLPRVESVIVASDFILGILLIVAIPLPAVPGALVAAFLAIFHGYEHGTLMPSTASSLAYSIGLTLGTAALHWIGIGLGSAIDRCRLRIRSLLFRLSGGAIAIGAVYVLVK